MARGGVDVLYLRFSMVRYITMLLHFLIYLRQACFECCVCYSESTLHFLLIIILLSSLSVAQVNVPGVWVFLLYPGGLQIICSKYSHRL